MKGNPFSLDFGGTPYLLIPRYAESSRMISTFSSEIPSTHIFMIMGARGNGKTVLMSTVKEELVKDDSWIHIDLSPESDMMQVFAASLYQKTKKKFSGLKLKVDLNLKVASVSATTENQQGYTSIYTDLDAMLEHLRDNKMKVLITVDEAINSKAVREFTSFFQHCLREKYPVFLLMTGLYKNIRALQNDRSQTFLRRAPKVVLESLNLVRIAQTYKEVFSLTDDEATEMAKQTAGYSYAFQILGYLLFETKNHKITEKTLTEYKLILGESSYDKIWEELSPNERTVAKAAANAPDMVTVKELREVLNMNSNEFSTYQDTLEKSGIFSSAAGYGRISFALPYVREYISNQNL